MRSLLADYAFFLRSHPLWWLLPPLILLGALAALVFFGSGSDVAGMVYRV